MLKIKKEQPQKVELSVELSKELYKELTQYLRVGKHFKHFDKSVSLNDVIEVCLSNLVEEESYKSLLTQYNSEMEFKREKDRNRKKKTNNKTNNKSK